MTSLSEERVLRRESDAEVSVSPDVGIHVSAQTTIQATEIMGMTLYSLNMQPTVVTVRLGNRMFRFEVSDN